MFSTIQSVCQALESVPRFTMQDSIFSQMLPPEGLGGSFERSQLHSHRRADDAQVFGHLPGHLEGT